MVSLHFFCMVYDILLGFCGGVISVVFSDDLRFRGIVAEGFLQYFPCFR